MRLNKLIEGAPKIEIETLFVDSRQKVSKGMFFCLKGMLNDGHKYVPQAIANGAVCIVYTDDLDNYEENITYVKVEDVHKTLVDVTHRFYDFCTEKMKVFGVTGTNGKSSIALTIKNILNLYEPCGYIGTIGVEYGNYKIEMPNTTNDILTTMKLINDMYVKDAKAVALEVSSHGIEQHRIDGIDFDYCIFTNLTHEHLDYHGTMENYFEAKAKLFTNLDSSKTAIINIDDPYGRRLVKMTNARVVTYGIKEAADYTATNLQLFKDHSAFTLKYRGYEYRVETNLVARFNVSNLLAVIAALNEYGLDFESFLPHLRNIPQIDGRVEIINEGQPFNVIVDFSHTPDGFEKICEYASTITPKDKKIIALTGSAGKRDMTKRPMMGEVLDRYASLIILTEDDPRNESVTEIARQIAGGIKNHNYLIVEDRYDAIRQAIELADTDDTVLLLGKGDDDFMYREFGSEPYQGDVNIARECIRLYGIQSGDDSVE